MKKSRQLEMVQYQRHCGNEHEQAHDPSPGFKNKRLVGVNPPPNALGSSVRSKTKQVLKAFGTNCVCAWRKKEKEGG